MKARYRKYDTQQMSFLMIDPERFLEEHPLVELVDRFVEDHLDLEAFAPGRTNQDTGAPAVHPAAIMKVLFYSFATQRYSTRDIEEGLKCDAGLMFLARESRMDHSTIARFLNNHGEGRLPWTAQTTSSPPHGPAARLHRVQFRTAREAWILIEIRPLTGLMKSGFRDPLADQLADVQHGSRETRPFATDSSG